MKKTLATILCLVMILAMLPLAAFAGTIKLTTNAFVGVAVNQSYTYTQFGFNATPSTLQRYDSTLEQYGLTYSTSPTSFILKGTPTKTGTAKISLKDENSNVCNIEVTIRNLVNETNTVSAKVGENVNISCVYADHGLPSSGVTSVVADYTSLAEYGLGCSYSASKLTITGKPTKTGTAEFRLKVVCYGAANYITYKFNITSGVTKTTRSTSCSAKVGQAMSQTFNYSTLSFDTTGCSIQCESSTLNDYGLSFSFSGFSTTISGTPTKTGTAKLVIRAWKTGVENRLEITVNIADNTQTVTTKINAEMGKTVGEKIMFADLGISDVKSVSYGSSDLSSFGLTYAYSGSYAEIKGTPTKTGLATFTAVVTTGTVKYNVVINVDIANVTTKTTTVNAVVGEPFSKEINFDSLGFDRTGCGVNYEIGNLADFGLSATSGYSTASITGTPTKAGTATMRVVASKTGTRNYLVINIAVKETPESKLAAFNAIEGEPFEAVVTFADYGLSGSVSFDPTVTTLSQYGLSTSYTGLDGTIKGTPTKAGTAVIRYTIAKGGVTNTLDVYVVIAENKPAPTPTPDPDPAPVDTYVFPFIDVFESDWYYGDVYNANKMGLIDGKTKTLYKPADNMTYAEAIKLAACMHQYKKNGKVTLTNGTPNWYDSYVEYARTNGIPWDYKDYNAKITREDYVHIFYYALPADNYVAKNTINKIPDVPTNGTYYKEIMTFYKAGILTGSDTKGTFNPKSNIKRSEVAAILSRMMDASTRKSFTIQ